MELVSFLPICSHFMASEYHGIGMASCLKLQAEFDAFLCWVKRASRSLVASTELRHMLVSQFSDESMLVFNRADSCCNGLAVESMLFCLICYAKCYMRWAPIWSDSLEAA